MVGRRDADRAEMEAETDGNRDEARWRTEGMRVELVQTGTSEEEVEEKR
jgi:hypothetical protein